ncbi:phosphotransferase [Porticoccus sp. W117]|uniref:phosphotransferase n=1 Tax=Porticoccus sp. W117 TaxID=3054777 RepID=UPI002591BA91|nr:phosphotransferase [Porticoccus sp. W117]MDM3871470.1 phosphotransferase [Porticoccus sp. W117]
MTDNNLQSAIASALQQNFYKELRPSRGVFQADVYLVNVDDQLAVVKDFSRRPWWSRVLVCRGLIKREVSVLTHFADSGFVPQYYGLISGPSGRDMFAMEFLDGEHPGVENRGRWPQAYAQTQQFLAMFHQAGYAHNDFRRANILVQPDGEMRFFDFASAMRKPQSLKWLLFLKSWLVNYLQGADRASLLKMKPDLAGEPLTEAEIHSLRKPWLVRVLRYIWANGINKPILRRFK